MNRRHFLVAGLATTASSLLGAPVEARSRILRLNLLGQALIEHDLTGPDWPGRAALTKRLGKADACFTHLETVIQGPRAGAPTREALTLHTADARVLDTMKALNVRLLSTAGNHAFDLGSGGVLDTLDAIRAAGLPSAGTGIDLAAASAPAYRATPAGTVALVAFATGKIREGGAATAERPGVNELRRDASGQPVEADATRVLDAIAAAARQAQVVIAYQHNHDWEPNMADVPAWQRAFAHRCVEAGAAVFVGHGAPLLQGIEIHRGAPLFFGLGNFTFQTEKPPRAYPPEDWEGTFVECLFVDGRCRGARLVPLALDEIGRGGSDDQVTRGMPTIATGDQAHAILQRVAERSLTFGTRLFKGAADGAELAGL